MAAPYKIKKEEIVEKALLLARKGGLDAINARALAKEIGCSTMPLFSSFKSMDEIKNAVIEQAKGIYKSYLDKETVNNPKPFKGIGTAYILFAKQEPQLFKILFMTSQNLLPENSLSIDANRDNIARAAQKATGLSLAEAKRFYFEMWIFTHGIATMCATKTIIFSESEISQMLTDIFQGLLLRYKGEKKNG